MAALILAVASEKGGVGKTTLTVQLGTCLHREGRRVLLVDSDPQGSLQQWAIVASKADLDAPSVIALDGAQLSREVPRLGADRDVVIIDTPPRLEKAMRAAMIVSHCVLLPVVGAAYDAWASERTLSSIEEAKSVKASLLCALVPNKVDRTHLSRITRAALGSLPVPMLDNGLSQRVTFGEAALEGQGVVDYAPDSDAAREVRRLLKSVLSFVAKGGTA